MKVPRRYRLWIFDGGGYLWFCVVRRAHYIIEWRVRRYVLALAAFVLGLLYMLVSFWLAYGDFRGLIEDMI